MWIGLLILLLANCSNFAFGKNISLVEIKIIYVERMRSCLSIKWIQPVNLQQPLSHQSFNYTLTFYNGNNIQIGGSVSTSETRYEKCDIDLFYRVSSVSVHASDGMLQGPMVKANIRDLGKNVQVTEPANDVTKTNEIIIPFKYVIFGGAIFGFMFILLIVLAICNVHNRRKCKTSKDKRQSVRNSFIQNYTHLNQPANISVYAQLTSPNQQNTASQNTTPPPHPSECVQVTIGRVYDKISDENGYIFPKQNPDETNHYEIAEDKNDGQVKRYENVLVKMKDSDEDSEEFFTDEEQNLVRKNKPKIQTKSATNKIEHKIPAHQVSPLVGPNNGTFTITTKTAAINNAFQKKKKAPKENKIEASKTNDDAADVDSKPKPDVERNKKPTNPHDGNSKTPEINQKPETPIVNIGSNKNDNVETNTTTASFGNLNKRTDMDLERNKSTSAPTINVAERNNNSSQNTTLLQASKNLPTTTTSIIEKQKKSSLQGNVENQDSLSVDIAMEGKQMKKKPLPAPRSMNNKTVLRGQADIITK